MASTTLRLLDALRAAHGNCSDYRAAKLLGVGVQAVSKWRRGVSHMSTGNVQKACQLAGLEAEVWEWNVRIAAERERGPDGDIYRQAVADLDSFQRTGQMAESGIFALLTGFNQDARKFLEQLAERGKPVAIMAAALFASVGANIEESSAAAPSSAEPVREVCIFCQIARRWLRRLQSHVLRLRRARWLPPFLADLELAGVA